MTRGAFVHIPKTGGTSLKAMFGEAVYHNAHLNYGGVRKQFVRFEHHTEEEWDVLFTFAFVRNPWGRMLSYFVHTRGHSDTKRLAEFIRTCSGSQPRKSMNPGDMIGNTPISFVGQCERMDRDVELIAFALGIDAPKMRYLNQTTKRVQDWRTYYDEEAYDCVAELGKWEIDRFGYMFDDCAIQHAA